MRPERSKTRRFLGIGAYVAFTLLAVYGAYVIGWYRGLTYHAVISGMSEAKWSLSAARSLRQADPALALELLDANISWADVSLRDSVQDVPLGHEGNYLIVLRSLEEYQQLYGATGSQ